MVSEGYENRVLTYTEVNSQFKAPVILGEISTDTTSCPSIANSTVGSPVSLCPSYTAIEYDPYRTPATLPQVIIPVTFVNKFSNSSQFTSICKYLSKKKFFIILLKFSDCSLRFIQIIVRILHTEKMLYRIFVLDKKNFWLYFLPKLEQFIHN